MNLESFIIPYPYKAYDKYERRTKKFNEYKDTIYDWVDKNTNNIMDISSRIDLAFSYINKTKYNNTIKKWFESHSEKLKYISDFSGIAFGIQFDEATEKIYVRFPVLIDKDDIQLYPNYNEIEFKNMSIIDRLDWMYINCEFIPFRILHESIIVESDSYKFSHIKRDKNIMVLLEKYFKDIKFSPKDDIYYFIKFNSKTKQFYLNRDLDKSPKKN